MNEFKRQSRQIKYQTKRYQEDPELRAKLKEQVRQNYSKRFNSEDPLIREATRERKEKSIKHLICVLRQEMKKID